MMKRKLSIAAATVAIFIVIAVIGQPTALHKAGLHPPYEGKVAGALPGKRALIVTTSHGVLALPSETEGPPTGVAVSELTHPYYNFLQSGLEIDVASIKGGEIPIAPGGLKDRMATEEDKRFLGDSILQAKVKNSIPVDEIDFTQYDIIFLSGGWGAAYDMGQSPVLGQKITDAYYSDREPLIGGVCHGVLGLINARDREGNLLIKGRRMTGVTDKQIKELKIEVTPLHPETELRKAGARFEANTAFRDLFANHTAVDDEKRFVTGQNQNSGRATSQAMLLLLEERSAL
jgi:putative intracellular protease/amidase